MAIYFAADHVVWASQAGLYTDKEGTERYMRHILSHVFITAVSQLWL